MNIGFLDPFTRNITSWTTESRKVYRSYISHMSSMLIVRRFPIPVRRIISFPRNSKRRLQSGTSIITAASAIPNNFMSPLKKSITYAGIDKQVPQNAARSGGIHTYRFLTNFQFLRLRFACRPIRTPSVIIIIIKAITTAACFMPILRLLRCFYHRDRTEPCAKSTFHTWCNRWGFPALFIETSCHISGIYSTTQLPFTSISPTWFIWQSQNKAQGSARQTAGTAGLYRFHTGRSRRGIGSRLPQ